MSTLHKKSLLPVYLQGLCSGKYTLQQASQSTGYSENWLCILKRKYKEQGLSVLDNKNQYRVPVNKKPESLKQQIALIYGRDFQDVNFAYFRRCLAALYDINISIPTLSAILKDYGFTSPEAHHKKKKKPTKRPRLRRANEGDMIQIDGTPYAWFYKAGNNKRYCLTGSIDDATGKITGLYMTEFECLYGYLEILRQTCSSYGVPREIYSDRAAIFCVTPKSNKKRRKSEYTKWEELECIHTERTQWQRVLSELNINQILAWSPEAKGRVERMWRTIQGQLPVWLHLHHATTVESANALLPRYIAEFNSCYSVEPERSDTFWLDPPQNLDHILQARITRRTDSVGVFSFHSYKFAVEYNAVSYRNIELCISERGIVAYVDGHYFPVRCLEEPLSGLGETMPHVLQDLVYRYLFSFSKEISA